MMKSSSLLFGLSLLLLTTFIGARYFGLLPYVTRMDNKQTEIIVLAAYVLLLVGIILRVLALMKPGGAEQLRDQSLLAIAGVMGAVLGVLTFWDGNERALKAKALELLVTLEKSRPPNTRFCRCAAAKLDSASLAAARERKPFRLSGIAGDHVETCLSDLKEEELKGLITQDRELTRRGVSEFSDRVNRILEADDNVAFAVNNGLASKDLVVELMSRGFAIDAAIAKRFADEFGYNGWPNVQKIGVKPSDSSCNCSNALCPATTDDKK